MIGHQSIIATRLRGYMPPQVWVFVLDAVPTYYPGTHPEVSLENGMHPEVHILPDEVPATLDFRFLRGAIAHINGKDEARVRAVMSRVAHFEPARILATGFGGLIDSEAA